MMPSGFLHPAFSRSTNRQLTHSFQTSVFEVPLKIPQFSGLTGATEEGKSNFFHSINTPGDINKSNITVQNGVTSIAGSVTLQDSTAGVVYGHESVHLTNCSGAKYVCSMTGDITLDKTLLSCTVSADKNAFLYNSEAGHIISASGKATLLNSTAHENIQADKGVTLKGESKAKSIVSNMGHVTVANSTVEETIEAAKNVRLNGGSTAKNIKSHSGKVFVNQSMVSGTIDTAQRQMVLKGEGTEVNNITFNKIIHHDDTSFVLNDDQTVTPACERLIELEDGIITTQDPRRVNNLWGMLGRNVKKSYIEDLKPVQQVLELRPGVKVNGTIEFKNEIGLVKVHEGVEFDESQVVGGTVEYVV